MMTSKLTGKDIRQPRMRFSKYLSYHSASLMAYCQRLNREKGIHNTLFIVVIMDVS